MPYNISTIQQKFNRCLLFISENDFLYNSINTSIRTKAKSPVSSEMESIDDNIIEFAIESRDFLNGVVDINPDPCKNARPYLCKTYKNMKIEVKNPAKMNFQIYGILTFFAYIQ